MKNIIFLILLLPFLLLYNGCKRSPAEPLNSHPDITPVEDTAHVRKPNLYIYPEETLDLSVNIQFPRGGNITESIPEYNNSWDFIVDINGKINNQYEYLYYECNVPKFAQKEFGWVIKKEKLSDFFQTNLSESGFNQKEINDFLEYWIPKLVDSNFYEVYPQYKSTLDGVIEINFSIEPNNFYRLCYLFVERDDNNFQIKEPKIETALRNDFYAVEWGGILE